MWTKTDTFKTVLAVLIRPPVVAMVAIAELVEQPPAGSPASSHPSVVTPKDSKVGKVYSRDSRNQKF